MGDKIVAGLIIGLSVIRFYSSENRELYYAILFHIMRLYMMVLKRIV